MADVKPHGACTFGAALLLLTAVALLSSTSVLGQAEPSANTQTFGRWCSNRIPGCRTCQLVRRPNTGRGPRVRPGQEGATASGNVTAEHWWRTVYVCSECLPGWELAGTGNLNDPRPRFCVLAGTQNTSVVDTCTGNCGRRGLIDRASNRRCFCDYWCNLYDDCCGGMNGAAAAAKDAACPDMSPQATDLNTASTCSNSVSVLAGDGQCNSYRPGGCWCDQFCTAAGDCCNSCPAACGVNTCTAPRARRSDRNAVADGRIPGKCGTQPRTLGDVSTAAFTQDLEGRMQSCQTELTETDLSTPEKQIRVVLVNTITANNGNAGYTAEKTSLLLQETNTAFARAGISFTLALQIDFNFANHEDVAGDTCYDDRGNFSPNCNRCRAYRSVPADLQDRKTLFLYMAAPNRGNTSGPVLLGQATFPWWFYGQNRNNAPATLDSCTDGAYSLASAGGPEVNPTTRAVLADAATVIHEIGHWLGLHHTWYQGQQQVTDDVQCAQQSGQAFDDWQAVQAALTDGIRDTPPQLASYVPDQKGRVKQTPIFFTCEADGSFNPTNNRQRPQTLACNGGSKAAGRYYNNFNNIMSYFAGGCADRTNNRRKTFTAGQVARMNCAWRCFRLNECDAGTFPWRP